jgi:hypothetical protein
LIFFFLAYRQYNRNYYFILFFSLNQRPAEK